jgi:hypothetical protein
MNSGTAKAQGGHVRVVGRCWERLVRWMHEVDVLASDAIRLTRTSRSKVCKGSPNGPPFAERDRVSRGRYRRTAQFTAAFRHR